MVFPQCPATDYWANVKITQDKKGKRLFDFGVSHAHGAACHAFSPAQSFDQRLELGLDIVFLRNALIYFDAENQEQIVSLAREVMQDDARLILGESESLSRLNTPFRYEIPLVYSIERVPA